MAAVPSVLLLLIGVAVVHYLARRVGVLPPLMLVVIGVAASFIPDVPDYSLDPEVVLVAVLPPLLYAAAVDTSVPAFRRNLRPIFLLAVGLVLFTAAAVAAVTYAVVPRGDHAHAFTLAAALAFGAIVAPPDAVAATAVARRTGLPRRIVTVLEGESLVNDATALTLLTVALATFEAHDDLGSPSVWGAAVARFLLTGFGGVVVGWVIAHAVALVRRHTQDDVVLDTTISLLTPFTAYYLGERLHVSGVLAVVVAGMWIGHRAPVQQSAGSRLQAQAIWRTTEFLLQGVVFALVGLQLRRILTAITDNGSWHAAGVASVAVVAIVVVSRVVWIFPATYLPRLVPAIRRRDPMPPWQQPAVISWSGMRGVVSLAAVLSLPRDFPQRALLVFLTFVVIAATLVGQGATLPWLIRRLHLRPPDEVKDFLAEANLQQQAATAALGVLDDLLDGQQAPDGVADRLRRDVEDRAHAAWERLGSGVGQGAQETPSAAYRRLRRAMLNAERDVFVKARDDGRLEEEVLRHVLRDLDLEETLLTRE